MSSETPSGDVRIIVGQRGWVTVGEYSRVGEWIILKNAHTIRRWGTTQGLGELYNGPLDQTVLDREGDCECHTITTIKIVRCNPEKWLRVLRAW